ncbi:MAG: hypothetical protein KF744_10055 [Taibaiella sp.]|nr:hypothetical protein [Taibaiella sp.]
MRFASFILLSLLLSSCYKNKCYTCTVKRVSSDMSINVTKVYPEQYCGKSPKDIDKIEKEGSYTTTQPNPITGTDVDVTVTTTCVAAGK